MPNGEITEDQARAAARLDWEFHKQEALDRLRIQESLGHSILKALTLTNGGALIALFTFLGNSPAKMQVDTHLLWAAFGAFVTGLVLTLLANTCAYFMQVENTNSTVYQMWNSGARAVGSAAAYDPDKPFRAGKRFERAMIVAAILALIAFCVGAGLALAAVTS